MKRISIFRRFLEKSEDHRRMRSHVDLYPITSRVLGIVCYMKGFFLTFYHQPHLSRHKLTFLFKDHHMDHYSHYNQSESILLLYFYCLNLMRSHRKIFFKIVLQIFSLSTTKIWSCSCKRNFFSLSHEVYLKQFFENLF